MSNLALAFDILARDRASRTLDKVGDSAEKAGGRLQKLGTTAKVALAGTAAAGVAAFGAAMVQGAKDAVSFETLAKKSEAVLKSTGNTAGTSVKGIQALAGSLESLSGVDEELIINSQNVLATFRNIRNVGGEKIFDKAAASALDMSVALGKDLQGASTMVGKALNDPVKGIAALGRAGVQFTAEQKEQIKTMVAAGDTLGAQKVILGELETQFGGTAKAAGSGLGGSMARLQDVVGDTFRTVATAALPTLTKLAEAFARWLPGAIEKTQQTFGAITGFIGDHKESFVVLGVVVGGALVGAFLSWAASAAAAAAATLAAAAPVLALGAALAVLTAGIVWAYQNVGFFRAAVDAVARFLTGTLWPAIQTGAGLFTGTLIPAIQGVIEWYWNFYSAAFDVVGKVVGKFGEIVAFFAGLPGSLADSAGDVFGFLWTSFKGVMNTVIRAWNGLEFKLPDIDWDPPGPGSIKVKGPTLGFPDIDELWTGARNYKGGWALVGERGPELLDVPRGANVFSAGDTSRMMRGGDVIFQIAEARHYDEDALLRAAAARLAVR